MLHVTVLYLYHKRLKTFIDTHVIILLLSPNPSRLLIPHTCIPPRMHTPHLYLVFPYSGFHLRRGTSAGNRMTDTVFFLRVYYIPTSIVLTRMRGLTEIRPSGRANDDRAHPSRDIRSFPFPRPFFFCLRNSRMLAGKKMTVDTSHSYN